jgi:hypothetical protein
MSLTVVKSASPCCFSHALVVKFMNWRTAWKEKGLFIDRQTSIELLSEIKKKATQKRLAQKICLWFIKLIELPNDRELCVRLSAVITLAVRLRVKRKKHVMMDAQTKPSDLFSIVPKYIWFGRGKKGKELSICDRFEDLEASGKSFVVRFCKRKCQEM